MTWVIGAASLLGTGALISDARVLFANGTTAEMLQKVYPIGNYMGAGFAGSVCIGFQMIEDLRALCVPERPVEHVLYPDVVAHTWQARAQEIFKVAPEMERRLGCQILLVGTAPIEREEDGPFPRVYVIRLSAPDFQPHFFNRGLQMCSIGTGAGVTYYKLALRPLFRMSSGIHQAFTVGWHHWARTLAFTATTVIRDRPNEGISQHLHFVSVMLGEIIVANNDMKTYPKDAPPIELAMPPVAQSWNEFNQMAEAFQNPSASAMC